jgi:hypothetical protein
VDKIEREGWRRQRRQVTADRRSCSSTGHETLGRYGDANAGERKNTASAIEEMVLDLDEGSYGSSRERDGAKRRDRPVNVAGRQALASKDGHSARSGEREDEHARGDAIGEPHLVEGVDRDDHATDPLAKTRSGGFGEGRPVW